MTQSIVTTDQVATAEVSVGVLSKHRVSRCPPETMDDIFALLRHLIAGVASTGWVGGRIANDSTDSRLIGLMVEVVLILTTTRNGTNDKTADQIE